MESLLPKPQWWTAVHCSLCSSCWLLWCVHRRVCHGLCFTSHLGPGWAWIFFSKPQNVSANPRLPPIVKTGDEQVSKSADSVLALESNAAILCWFGGTRAKILKYWTMAVKWDLHFTHTFLIKVIFSMFWIAVLEQTKSRSKPSSQPRCSQEIPQQATSPKPVVFQLLRRGLTF